MINCSGALLVNRTVVNCYIGAKAADPLFSLTLLLALEFDAQQNMHLALAIAPFSKTLFIYKREAQNPPRCMRRVRQAVILYAVML